MTARCIRDFRSFRAGEQYAACPVLCGYQIDTVPGRGWRDESIRAEDVDVVLDADFQRHFSVK